MNNLAFAFCGALLLGLCSSVWAGPASTATGGKDPVELLRQGLFEEEANRDLGKAAAAYAGVVELYDAQRTFAATAMFRLAEVRVAQGNKAEAASLYQRVLTEFPNQDPLAKLSRERLAVLGAPVPTPAGSPPAAIPDDEEGKMLAQYEAEPNVHGYDSIVDDAPYNGTTPMIYAAGRGWTRLLNFLLDHGGHVGGYGYGGEPLRAAAASGQKDAVALLLSRGASIDKAGAYGWTALHAACLGRHAEVVSLLLEKGANPDVYCSRSPDPKQIPVHAWGPALSKALPAWKDVPLGTPLLIAVRNGDTDILARLLDHHADPNFYDTPGTNDDAKSSPLIFALRIGQTAAAQLLIDRGANIKHVTPDGFTVLHAAAAGVPTLVPALLDKGVPQTADSNGWTPLFYSVYLGGSRHNLNEAKGEENLTPLPDFMNRLGAYESAWDALLKYGADLNARDRSGRTLMHYSVPDDYHPTEVPGWLVAHGADINARGPRGQTPLMAFCDYHHMNWPDPKQNREAVAGVTWFMEHGADANAKDDNGQTPLKQWSGNEGRALTRKYILPGLIGKSLGAHAVTALADTGSGFPPARRVESQAEFDLPPSLVLLMELALSGSYYPDLTIDIHRAGPDGKETGVERVNADLSKPTVDPSKWPNLHWGDVVIFSTEHYWSGDSEGKYRQLAAGKTRTVTVQIGDQTATLTLADPAADSLASGSLLNEISRREMEAQAKAPPPGSYRPATPVAKPDPRLHEEPDDITAWTPVVKVLPGWTLSELVLHLTQAEPRARLDQVHLFRTVDGKPHDWALDLRASNAAEAEPDWDGRPSGVKRVPVWLADGDRLVIPLPPAADAEALAARRNTICFEGPGGLFVQPVFTRSPDDLTSHTLGELLMQAYLSPMVIPNPNLSKIVIHRLTGNGAEEEHKPVDLTQTILASQTVYNAQTLRQGDLPLQWGDRVEIAPIEGVDPLKWKELSPATQNYLNTVLARPVVVTLNGERALGPDEGRFTLNPVFKPYDAIDGLFPVRFEQKARGETGTFTALTLLRQLQINLDTMTRFTLQKGDGVHDYDLKALIESNPWLGFDSRVNIQQLSP